MANELVLRDIPAAVPAMIRQAGGNARFAYEEFFRATLNNPHTPGVGLPTFCQVKKAVGWARARRWMPYAHESVNPARHARACA